MKVSIIFAFLKKDGSIETDEYGCEMYHREEIGAETEQKAVEQFKDYFKDFENKPEIIEIIGE